MHRFSCRSEWTPQGKGCKKLTGECMTRHRKVHDQNSCDKYHSAESNSLRRPGHNHTSTSNNPLQSIPHASKPTALSCEDSLAQPQKTSMALSLLLGCLLDIRGGAAPSTGGDGFDSALETLMQDEKEGSLRILAAPERCSKSSLSRGATLPAECTVGAHSLLATTTSLLPSSQDFLFGHWWTG